ncbi:MAG: serine/threonine-protein kinase, partial [Planctomycetia bacterium]
MSEQEFHPEANSTPPKRGSSLLRHNGNGSSRASGPIDRTVISSEPPMSAVNVHPAELEGPFRVGDRLGVYELTQYVGGGGMGSVYQATDTLLDREVAIKILLPEAAGTEEAVLRFQNEARSAARLDNDGIAKVYYVGEEEGLPFLVFEYIDGINLRDMVRQRGPLPLSEAIGISLQVADALAHANDHGVVHRDVKPSNILLREDGQVKLIDFGLARIVEVEERDNDLTASGVTLGTFDYISPEQARDPRTVDIRSDIYSLGCALFYMLTGRPPFPEGTVLQKLLQHQGDRPPNVREFRPELPEEIGLLLDRMLAKDPSNRFQDPLELRDQIALLASQLGLRSRSLGIKNWAMPSAHKPSFFARHSPWILPVTALLVIVLGLDFYWNRQTWDKTPVSANNQDPKEHQANTPFPTIPHSSEKPKSPSDTNHPAHTGTVDNHPSSENGTGTLQGSSPTDSNPSETNPDLQEFPSSLLQYTNEAFNPDNVRIQSSSPWETLASPYEIKQPGTYSLPIVEGSSPILEPPNLLEGNFGSEEESTNWHPLNGSGSRINTNDLNLSGMTTRFGFLTVGDPKEGSVSFPSLAAACRAATT